MNKRNVIITIISVLVLTCIIAFARTTTTDLGLVKPTWTENVDILDDINANSDILEAFANDPLEFDTGERLEDRAGAMWTGNTETGITITYQDADNTIDAVIGANDIVESMLKAVNLPADEDIATYESTTGDFEWHTLAELGIQPLDAGLTSIAGLTTAANKSIYTTALDTYTTYDLTAFARTILDDAAATNARDTLGLTIGTNVQAYDATLLSIAALGTAADKIAYTTAIDTWAETVLTAFGRTIVDDADASAVRTTIGTVIGTNVQAYDAGLLSLAGLTYASDSFIKVTATDTYAIRTIAETLTDLSLNNVTNVATSDTAYDATSWDASTDAATKNAIRDKIETMGAGYTNLTSFVDQTAWRLFYSNTDGDVVELALGADGTYLKSGGATAAPTWEAPAGGGTVTTSGTPVANDIARFTGATVIEGLSYAEFKTALDLEIGTDIQAYSADNAFRTDKLSVFAATTSAELAGVISNETGSGLLVYGTSPTIESPTITGELGGELDAGAHSIGFTQQTVTYNVTTTTVDWTLGNKATVTLTGNVGTLAFTNPTNPCNVLLKIVQDATGSRVITAWDADIKWAGGTAPTLTTTANGIDICSFYWDGTNYFGVASLAFATP